MLNEEKIRETLSNIIDPELNLNLVEMGLIYNVSVIGAEVKVEMTLTTRGCPLHQFLAQQVEKALSQIEGVEKAQVKLVWDPPWHPKMMSPEAKRKIGFSDEMMDQ
jgi:metal-sulfur cluster biosynthetic enzyme